MKARQKRKPATAPLPEREVQIESLDHEGCGVARVDGKVWLVAGALPGERVRARPDNDGRRVVEATCTDVIEASAERIEPRCRHSDQCGGCRLQHLDSVVQPHQKQLGVARVLERVANLSPARWLAPLTGDSFGYRTRARLAVLRHRDKSGRWLGFKARASDRIISISECPVLHPALESLIEPLQQLVSGLPPAACPAEIHLGVDDSSPGVVGLLFDGMTDATSLVAVIDQRSSLLAGVGVIHLRDSSNALTHYRGDADSLRLHPEDDLELRYAPGQFVQANADMNRKMVAQVMELLAPSPTQTALDLFCGLGNFTLPLARRCAEVTGIDLGHALIESARQNAARNGLDNVRFESADLGADPGPVRWARSSYDLLLLDPPRQGAGGILATVARCAPGRIVYVSCYPGSLARDLAVLTGEHGYSLDALGVMDMFPQTAHVECVAVLAKKSR